MIKPRISYLRGHPILFKDGEWLYMDTNTPTIGNERDCGYCGSENNREGHDGCLGTLSGVMNVCCGHGITDEAYIQFSPGRCLFGEDAINEINRMLYSQNCPVLSIRIPIMAEAKGENVPAHIDILR